MAGKSSSDGDPFLTSEDLIAHMKGRMFPKGKQFAPSLVMWGDPHGDHAGDQSDIDNLDHMSKPEDDES
ncbi:hypothetical protein ACI5KX_08885 [Erythrobacter sp. GH1-10]|uniref:hypothetical protein n=1 Tax=Erythrobacter sp. GH1-10 TaxID=3349334 RepID=UPI003877F9FF